jgi:hypothetical protein
MIGNIAQYVDYQGNILPNHDGTMIEVKDIGFQYFGLDGRGFIHDGTPITLPDGQRLFFLHDGKPLIHNGSPIELSSGMMQYFDHTGLAIWPIDEKT